MKQKKQQTKRQRDYNDYLERSAVKVKVRVDTPLRYAIVFACALAMLICMMLPFHKVYVYEGAEGIGILPDSAVEYPLNTYRMLRWGVESLGGGGGGGGTGITPAGPSLGNVTDWISDNGMGKIIFGDNDVIGAALPHIVVITAIGAVLILLQLAQFCLSIGGLLGANRVNYYLKIISLATAAISIGWVTVAALFYMAGKLLFGLAYFTIIFSYGTPLILVLAAASAASMFFINK